MIIFYLILSILNIFVLLLVRFLVKRNKLVYPLAYLTITLQTLVLITSIFRKRSFISFEMTLFFLTLTITALCLGPLLLDFVLSDKRKQSLYTAEENFKIYLLDSFDKFLEYHRTIRTFCEFFSTNLTNFLSLILFNNKLYWFVLGPWVCWIFFFFYETLLTNCFKFSPYFFVYYLISYRILVLACYITKNEIDFKFRQPLRQTLNCYFPIEMLDLQTMTSLVLNPQANTKEKKIILWNNFNVFLHFFVDGTIFKNLYYVDLVELKKTLDFFNFFLIASIVLVLIFPVLFQTSLFFLYFSSICLLYGYSLITKEQNISVVTFNNIFKDLREYIGHFKYVLIKEHNFSLEDVDNNFSKPIRLIKPYSFQEFLIPFLKGKIFFLLIFCFFDILDFFNFKLLNYFLFFTSFEPLIFLMF